VPVHKCPNGKYRIGSGPCMYTSKEKAERAYKAYRVKKHMKEAENLKEDLRIIRESLEKAKQKIMSG